MDLIKDLNIPNQIEAWLMWSSNQLQNISISSNYEYYINFTSTFLTEASEEYPLYAQGKRSLLLRNAAAYETRKTGTWCLSEEWIQTMSRCLLKKISKQNNFACWEAVNPWFTWMPTSHACLYDIGVTDFKRWLCVSLFCWWIQLCTIFYLSIFSIFNFPILILMMNRTIYYFLYFKFLNFDLNDEQNYLLFSLF